MKRHSLITLILLLVIVATATAATVEKRTLVKQEGFYLLFKPDKFDPKQKYDLLIVLHGTGDTAQHFAESWKGLVDSRSNLLLAVPQGQQKAGSGYDWGNGHVQLIAELIKDATTNCAADPKHVMLVGFSAGGLAGFNIVASMPESIACFGGIATCFPVGMDDAYEQALKKAAATVAVYYAVGTRDPTKAGSEYNNVVAKLKALGFNLKTERPNCGHTGTSDEIKSMMEFFDSVLKKNDEAKPAPPQR